MPEEPNYRSVFPIQSGTKPPEDDLRPEYDLKTLVPVPAEQAALQRHRRQRAAVDADPAAALKLYEDAGKAGRGAWDEEFGTLPGSTSRRPDPALVEAVKDDPYNETAWPDTPAVRAAATPADVFAWWAAKAFLAEAGLGVRRGRPGTVLFGLLMAGSAALAAAARPFKPKELG
jgi:hypothetical protein